MSPGKTPPRQVHDGPAHQTQSGVARTQLCYHSTRGAPRHSCEAQSDFSARPPATQPAGPSVRIQAKSDFVQGSGTSALTIVFVASSPETIDQFIVCMRETLNILVHRRQALSATRRIDGNRISPLACAHLLQAPLSLPVHVSVCTERWAITTTQQATRARTLLVLGGGD